MRSPLRGSGGDLGVGKTPRGARGDASYGGTKTCVEDQEVGEPRPKGRA